MLPHLAPEPSHESEAASERGKGGQARGEGRREEEDEVWVEAKGGYRDRERCATG